MRAFLDANVYISYLLNPTAATPPASVVRNGLADHYRLVVSQTVLAEVRDKITAKRWLASRISASTIEAFLSLLVNVAEVAPELSEPFPTVGADRDDDYLFTHAVLGRADFLVSGDDHVLQVRQFAEVVIVSPAQFLQILERSGRV